MVEYVYDSWGKKLSTTGTLATTLGGDQPFRYRGYVYDNETGWYYLQSRYYDPTTCRFISADVYLSTGQGVLGHNAFAYCLNNPVNCSDSSGTRANDGALDIFGPPRAAGGGGGIIFVPIPPKELGEIVVGIGTWFISLFASDKAEPQAVPDVNEKLRKQAYFPENPFSFHPNGLIMDVHSGSSNGRIIKWVIPGTKIAVFEWDEDFKYGAHYHTLNDAGERMVPNIHYKPGDPVPEPWNTVFFGGAL